MNVLNQPIYVIPLTSRLGKAGGTHNFSAALEAAWRGYEACAVSYPGPNRLSKKKGDRPEDGCRWLFIDVDLVTKEQKKEPRYNVWDSAPEIEDFPGLWGPWAAVYATPGGYRAVYYLSESVSPEAFEGLAKAVMKEYGDYADEACSDWTRLMRLPFVDRTWLPPSAPPDTVPHGYLGDYPELLGGLYMENRVLDITSIAWEPAKPVDVSQALIQDFGAYPTAEPAAADIRMLQMNLPGHDGQQAIKNQTPFEPGGRDNMAAKATGRFAIAGRRAGLSLESTWACLMYPFEAGAAMPPAEPELPQKAWNFLASYWEADEKKIEQWKQEKIDREASVSDTLLERWKDVNTGIPESWGGEDLNRYLVLAGGRTNQRFVLTDSGHYVEVENQHQGVLREAIAAVGVDQITTEADVKGEIKKLPGREIFGSAKPAIEECPRGYEWDGTDRVKVDFKDGRPGPLEYTQGFAPLDDSIEPKYSPQVDQFLRLGFRHMKQSVECWLSAMLDVQTTALPIFLIRGEPMCGKSLLFVSALRLFRRNKNGTMRKFMEVSHRGDVRQFNKGLVEDILLIQDDEVCPDGSEERVASVMKPLFRQLVTARGKQMEAKGKDKVPVSGYHRCAMTTNSKPLVTSILSNSATKEGDMDHQATLTRIFAVTMHADTLPMLEALVRDPAQMDAFQDEIASHILWLNINRERVFEEAGLIYTTGRMVIPSDVDMLSEAKTTTAREYSLENTEWLTVMAQSISKGIGYESHNYDKWSSPEKAADSTLNVDPQLVFFRKVKGRGVVPMMTTLHRNLIYQRADVSRRDRTALNSTMLRKVSMPKYTISCSLGVHTQEIDCKPSSAMAWEVNIDNFTAALRDAGLHQLARELNTMKDIE